MHSSRSHLPHSHLTQSAPVPCRTSSSYICKKTFTTFVCSIHRLYTGINYLKSIGIFRIYIITSRFPWFYCLLGFFFNNFVFLFCLLFSNFFLLLSFSLLPLLSFQLSFFLSTFYFSIGSPCALVNTLEPHTQLADGCLDFGVIGMYRFKYFYIVSDASLLDEPTLEAGDLLDPVGIVAETEVDVSITLPLSISVQVGVVTPF